jgi:tetratricopeptide (TPR) repeat protein
MTTARAGDPAALRLLARSSIQLGPDDAALGIYTRRLEAKSIQAEDYLLLGVVLKRRGRDDGAMWAWNEALEAEPVPAQTLGDLTKLLYAEAVENEAPENMRPHPLGATARAAERLSRQPGWESQGDMMLGIVCRDSLDLTGAAEAFRRMLDRDPNVAESNAQPVKLRELFARTFLGVGRPAEARPHLQSILARGPDPEASWLLSRVYVKQGAIAEAQEALARAGSYRGDKPLEDEPSPYVGEASCQKCHAAIFQGETISVRAEVAKCLYCHTRYPRAGRERIGPETADRAIGCERCHGPGGNHLAAVAAGFSDPAIVNPASGSPQAVAEERCNDCHVLDRSYRHRDPEQPGWVRSQGAGSTWSRCNTESGGAFGCVTCHEPHKGVRSTTTEQYEAKCLACHSATTVEPAGGLAHPR